MHRKMIYVSWGFICALLISMAAPAAQAGTTSGCGVGYKVMKGDSGFFANWVAMTVNDSSSTSLTVRYLGITSATSGCDPDDVVFHNKQQERFALVHMDTLSVEMARGDGEHVRAMASLLGCEASAQAKFGYWAQERHAQLFSAERTQAQTWLDGIKRDLSREDVFVQACANLG